MPLFSSSDPLSDPVASHSASNAGEDDAVWDQFTELLDELEHLAARSEPIQGFYRRLLSGCVEGLAAVGGMVFTRGAGGAFSPLVVQGLDTESINDRREQYEQLLARAEHLQSPQTESLAEESVSVAPVTTPSSAGAAALVLLVQRRGLAPEYYRASERLLMAVTTIAADAHARIESSELRSTAAWSSQLLRFSHRVSGLTDLEQTAYRITNDGRVLIGSDRLSLVKFRSGKPRLVSVSGAEAIEHRSGAARSLEAIARLAHNTDESIEWPSTKAEPHRELLDEYCDQSHARALCVSRIEMPTNEDANEKDEPALLGVLIAEWFEAPGDSPHAARLTELAHASSPALSNAAEWAAVPMARTLRALPRLQSPGVLTALACGAALAAALIAALVLVKVDHTVTLPGLLRPAQQRALFAPSDAIVDRVLVQSGQLVQADEPVLMLSSPALTLESERLAGELSEIESQLRAVGAARSVGESRAATSIEALRLTSEQRRLEQRAESLQAEIDLLIQQRDELVVRSPIAGKVVTWRPAELLDARPVERGQRLITIAEDKSPWLIELDAPDDRIGIILEARGASDEPLRVAYESLDGSGRVLWGEINRIASRAETPDPTATSSGASVTLEVVPEMPLSPLGADAEAIPDTAVRARVYCGKRSLGYVWLHDAWSVATRWWRL